MEAVNAILSAVIIVWALVVLIRLGDNNRQLKSIANEIAALRKATEEDRASR